MFGKKQEIDIGRIQPTSKVTLKMTCLAACCNNVEEAKKLYDFIAGDLNLPDTDIMPPNTFDRLKSGAEGLFGWIGEHKEDLINGWNMIQALRGGQPIEIGSATPPANVPPLPNMQ